MCSYLQLSEKRTSAETQEEVKMCTIQGFPSHGWPGAKVASNTRSPTLFGSRSTRGARERVLRVRGEGRAKQVKAPSHEGCQISGGGAKKGVDAWA